MIIVEMDVISSLTRNLLFDDIARATWPDDPFRGATPLASNDELKGHSRTAPMISAALAKIPMIVAQAV